MTTGSPGTTLRHCVPSGPEPRRPLSGGEPRLGSSGSWGFQDQGRGVSGKLGASWGPGVDWAAAAFPPSPCGNAGAGWYPDRPWDAPPPVAPVPCAHPTSPCASACAAGRCRPTQSRCGSRCCPWWRGGARLGERHGARCSAPFCFTCLGALTARDQFRCPGRGKATSGGGAVVPCGGGCGNQANVQPRIQSRWLWLPRRKTETCAPSVIHEVPTRRCARPETLSPSSHFGAGMAVPATGGQEGAGRPGVKWGARLPLRLLPAPSRAH